jgi:acyl dehydratase
MGPVILGSGLADLFYFEDLPLGGEWTTRGRTLTEADLSAFIASSADYNPLYADAEYAARSPNGGVVLPGSMISAVALGLGSMDVPMPVTIALVGMTWRFLAPVRPGDTVRGHWRLGRKRAVENPAWGLAVWQVDVTNQEEEVVASGEIARLVVRRSEPAAEPEPEAEVSPEAAEEAADRPAPRRRRRRSKRSRVETPAPEPGLEGTDSTSPAPDGVAPETNPAPESGESAEREEVSSASESETG